MNERKAKDEGENERRKRKERRNERMYSGRNKTTEWKEKRKEIKREKV